jgi:hypothetical protein
MEEINVPSRAKQTDKRREKMYYNVFIHREVRRPQRPDRYKNHRRK